MLAAHVDLREYVFVTRVIPLFVKVDHRPVDVELRDHLLLTRDLIDNQRVNLTRWLVHKATLACHPIMLKVAPGALDDIARHPRWMNVARQNAALAHTQQVAPAARCGVEQQGPKPDVRCLWHPDSFVVWNRLDGNFWLDARHLYEGHWVSP